MKNSGIPWIGEIPEKWKLERLKSQVVEINEKNSPLKTDYVLSLTIKDGVIPYEEKGDVGNKAKENHEEYKLAYPDTIVLNSMNILIGAVGICKYYGCVSPVYYVFKAADSSDLRYLNYIMSSTPYQKYLRKYANGILEIRLRVSSDDILKRHIPLPPLSEQQAIADFLDKKCAEIDQMVALQEKFIEELKAYKQSLITETVTKGLNPNAPMKDSGVEWIGEVPEGWDVSRIKGFIGRFSKGEGITKDEVFPSGNTPCVRYGEIYTKYNNSFAKCVSATKIEIQESPHYFEKGNILCAGTGELIEEIGKSIVYVGEKKCLAGGDIIILKHNQHPVFLNYALNCSYAQAQKSCSKAKLKVVHISASDIGNVLLALPPLSEQQAIADYLDKKCAEIDQLIAVKQKKADELKEYKKSIIYEYVTGKRSVCE